MSKRPLEDGPEGPNKKGKMDALAMIEAKKAEIQAKMAAMRQAKTAAPTPASKPADDPMGWTPDARRSQTASPAGSRAEEIRRQLEEKKRKVAEAHSRVGNLAALARANNMYNSSGKNQKEERQESGLNMAAHPLLLDTTPTQSQEQSKKARYKPMLPKFSTVKANVRNAPSPSTTPALPRSTSGTPKPSSTSNPYLGTETPPESDFPQQLRDRPTNRQFRFNQKGKYVHLAEKQRQEQQLEELKRRIAEKAEKAGMSGDSVGAGPGGGGIRRAAPPSAEWWDATLLPNQNYRDIDSLGMEGLSVLLETQANSPITSLIQHPIPIPPPGNLGKEVQAKVMLTTREQKKKRKLERKQVEQDKRDRVKMGLLPPDPPKVRLGNLMKVLTSSAVADPTKVEARVRREVAQRKHGHDKMNAERKLTDDQRQEKRQAKEEREENKGIWGAVYKIRTLSDPAHQFKVRKNADQMNLSGLCIFNPNFSFVYVEGSGKSTRAYKKLMLNRISWTTPARAREEPELVEDEEGNGAAPQAPTGTGETSTEAVKPVSLEGNRCDLVWEGQIRERGFTNFRARSCPTDHAARELLGEKMRGYWDMAKNWKEEDLE